MSSANRKPVILLSRNIVADMKDFDWEVYLLNYPDLVKQGICTKTDACNHYKKIGFWEKRSCRISDKFDAERYLKTYGHLGLKTPRDAYIHFMRIGSLLKKNEGLRKNIQPYRLPVATQEKKKPVIADVKPKILPQTSTKSAFIVPLRRAQPQVLRRSLFSSQSKNNTIIPSLLTMNTRRNVKQPKPGELVLTEPPSSYFKKICIIGPPKYLN